MFCERLRVLTEKVFEALELADDQGSMSPGTGRSKHINQLDATFSCSSQKWTNETHQALQT